MAQAMSFSEKGEKMELSQLKIPTHVSIIMDGNGRWAKSKGMPRTYGHSKGADVLMDICEDADALGIKYLTVYAFSTENWKRPEEEVSTLMNLFRRYLKEAIDTMAKDEIAVQVIGDLSVLAPDIRELVARCNAEAQKRPEFSVATLCINYGGRDEIKNAVRAIAQEVQAGQLKPEDITEDTISQHLYTAHMPDPDFIIRPSGEIRTSNFLLWQSAYAEYYFTDVLWPDFKPADMDAAIDEFNRRNRRFGGV